MADRRHAEKSKNGHISAMAW